MAATDNFANWQLGLDSPAIHAVTVTPDNTNTLSVACRALYVGAAGNVQIDTLGGETVVLIGVTAGSIIPIRATKVYVANTTATNMVAIW